jgi:hypothetical protein
MGSRSNSNARRLGVKRQTSLMKLKDLPTPVAVGQQGTRRQRPTVARIYDGELTTDFAACCVSSRGLFSRALSSID